MKAKLIVLLLGIATFACVPGPRPTGPTKAIPTFYINPPTSTPVTPTLAPFVTPTATPKVKWPVATLTIVSSLPISGTSKSAVQAMVNAETLRLKQASYKACGGKYELAFRSLDDASRTSGIWDPELENRNVTTAVEDPSVVAYVGGLTDDAAQLIIPLLDKAGPMVIISPGSSYPGLTKPISGDPGEPDVYYPAGVHNFARVVTSDEVQAEVAAEFMSKALGVRTVFILDDAEPYGYAIAHIFEVTARQLGMQVVGHEAITQKSRDFEPLMWRIASSNYGHAPDAIFASMLAENTAGKLLKDKVAVLGDNTKVKFVGPSGILTPSFIEDAGASAAQGTYATVAGVPFPDGLTEAGKQFLKDYQASYGVLNEPTAIYGYESMNAMLKAIEDVCASGGDSTDRKQVRDAVFGIRDFAGALGTWSFDPSGDTSLSDVTVYEVKDGAFEVVSQYR